MVQRTKPNKRNDASKTNSANIIILLDQNHLKVVYEHNQIKHVLHMQQYFMIISVISYINVKHVWRYLLWNFKLCNAFWITFESLSINFDIKCSIIVLVSSPYLFFFVWLSDYFFCRLMTLNSCSYIIP